MDNNDYKKILDNLVNYKNYNVRKAVAEQGYGLDKLVNDEECDVRKAVAEQCYRLDKLIDDKYWSVRKAVAEQRYGLDKLINDEEWPVRKAVAEQGYGLDILVNDEDSRVRIAANKQLETKKENKIELVISIDESTLKRVCNSQSVPDMLGTDIVNALNAIKNGVSLPKGHGSLKDLGDLEECKEIMNTIMGESKYAVRMDDIRNIPTIIEASSKTETEGRMSKCRYDSSEVCHNKDCFDCVLDKIKSEIRALSPNPTTEDAIIQTLNNMDRYVANELTLCDTNTKFPQNEVFIVDDVYEQIAEQLPPVTLKVEKEKESKDKYIKDSALKQESEDKGMNVLDINFALDVLSHPQSADESDINTALKFAIESLKACRDGLTESKDMGEVSDGYHTFNQLYHQRAVLFAAIVNSNKDRAWKSFKHFDGKYCFDSNGEWFIVGVDTPEGSYTYHYSKEYWDMFKCKELERGKEWDGHTENDVTRLLSLEK